MLNFLKYTLIKNSWSTTLKSRVRLAIWGGEGRLVEGLEMSFKASKTDGVTINYIETKEKNRQTFVIFLKSNSSNWKESSMCHKIVNRAKIFDMTFFRK